MTTDTSEKGLESIIFRHMTGTDGLAVEPNIAAERPPAYGGTGYTAGSPHWDDGNKSSRGGNKLLRQTFGNFTLPCESSPSRP